MTSISQERAALAEVGLVLRSREQAGLRFNYTSSRPVTAAVAGFNHISVTNPSAYSSNDAHWRAIENIGISRFGATGISYNGGVLPGGQLYEGQPWGRRGAHTVNTRQRATCSQSGCPSVGGSLAAPSWNNNVNGRALVFARNVADPVTDADVDAAARYWAGHKLAGLLHPSARLHGHRCCASKDCPGGRVWARMDDIADLTATYVRTGLPGGEEDDMFDPAKHIVAIAEKVWHTRIFNPVTPANTEGVEALVFVQSINSNAWRAVNGLRALANDPALSPETKAAIDRALNAKTVADLTPPGEGDPVEPTEPPPFP